jgi:phytoene synthase
VTASECEPKSEDVRLAASFISDPVKRADVLALHAFLETLRDIPERTTEPLMGEIRLRWWYEALEEIRDGHTPRYHPLTEALRRVISQYGLPVQNLLDCVEGQMPLLDMPPHDMKTALSVVDTGEGVIARLCAAILDPAGDATLLTAPARFHGLAQLKLRRWLKDAGDAEGAHLRRDAMAAARKLPAALMPLALPAALAEDNWTGRMTGPLSKRLRLFWAFVTGRI